MIDPSTTSNYENFSIKTLFLDWNIDLNKKCIQASAYYDFSRRTAESNNQQIVMDMENQKIHRISNLVNGRDLEYKVTSITPDFMGNSLSIQLDEDNKPINIRIDYEIHDDSSAINWMTSEQTSFKKSPFMYTQCQAIHARSIVPCMDSPGSKIEKIFGRMSCPDENIKILMAAIEEDENLMKSIIGLFPSNSIENTIHKNMKNISYFQLPQPTPSYLLAAVAGEMKSIEISYRSKVWAEPDLVEKYAKELTVLPNYLDTAESLLIKYPWGRYDVVVLPPSFPYGGMENPCLSFLTPTIFAEDKSLMSVVAHEIAHSWSGNYMTNINWEHFWLNEGVTRYIENIVVSKVFCENYPNHNFQQVRDFLTYDGYHILDLFIKRTVDSESDEKLKKEKSLLTKLKIDVKNIDPDDTVSPVPYEKGQLFLRLLEQELFENNYKLFLEFLKGSFLKADYHDRYMFSEKFVNALLHHFPETDQKKKKQIEELCEIIEREGHFKIDLLKLNLVLEAQCQTLLTDLMNCESEKEIDSFTSQFKSLMTSQKILLTHLLVKAGSKFGQMKYLRMNKSFDLESNRNSEIRFNWIIVGLNNDVSVAMDMGEEMVRQQGRMKYSLSLFRAMAQFDEGKGRNRAMKILKDIEKCLHPIALKKIHEILG
ncbi:hypothetical protein SNEBB_010938 [Seison nebaliae]|nr:hypothetical protein SNEBB_010938 [Seison nebaliae]